MPDSPSMHDKYGEATEQLWRTYGAINEWIRFADAKAAALLTVNGVVLSACLAALSGSRTYLEAHRFITIIAFLSVGSLVVSGFFCLDCILPKTKVGGPHSLLFFEDIAVPGHETAHPRVKFNFGRKPVDFSASRRAAKAYRRRALKLGNKNRAFVEISRQVWAVSNVAHKKHRQIACAVWALGIGFCFAILTGVVFVLS